MLELATTSGRSSVAGRSRPGALTVRCNSFEVTKEAIVSNRQDDGSGYGGRKDDIDAVLW